MSKCDRKYFPVRSPPLGNSLSKPLSESLCVSLRICIPISSLRSDKTGQASLSISLFRFFGCLPVVEMFRRLGGYVFRCRLPWSIRNSITSCHWLEKIFLAFLFPYPEFVRACISQLYSRQYMSYVSSSCSGYASISSFFRLKARVFRLPVRLFLHIRLRVRLYKRP